MEHAYLTAKSAFLGVLDRYSYESPSYLDGTVVLEQNRDDHFRELYSIDSVIRMIIKILL